MSKSEIHYPDGKVYTISSEQPFTVTLPAISNYSIADWQYKEIYESLPWICRLFLSEEQFIKNAKWVLE